MDKKIIKKLFKLSDKSYKKGEFPVAAIIYDKQTNKIISCGYNKRNRSNKTTDHAEIIAIQKANKKLKTWRFTNKCMVITLEPCDMCKTVIKEARINEVYYIQERLKYKKQYKCTAFKKSNFDSEFVEDYKRKITSFFKDKH